MAWNQSDKLNSPPIFTLVEQRWAAVAKIPRAQANNSPHRIARAAIAGGFQGCLVWISVTPCVVQAIPRGRVEPHRRGRVFESWQRFRRAKYLFFQYVDIWSEIPGFRNPRILECWNTGMSGSKHPAAARALLAARPVLAQPIDPGRQVDQALRAFYSVDLANRVQCGVQLGG